MLVAIAASSLAMALPVAAAAAALDASSRASGAADAAALAASDALLGWIEADPCVLASEVASSVDVKLEACGADAESGQVRISVSVQTMFGRVHARAHAGPPVA